MEMRGSPSFGGVESTAKAGYIGGRQGDSTVVQGGSQIRSCAAVACRDKWLEWEFSTKEGERLGQEIEYSVRPGDWGMQPVPVVVVVTVVVVW